MLKRFTTVSLISYYALYLPATLLFWVVQASAFSGSAWGQTSPSMIPSPPPQDTAADLPTRPIDRSTTGATGATGAPSNRSAQGTQPQSHSTRSQLLEEARRRLIEQGALSETGEAIAPNSGGMVGDSAFDVYRLGPGDTIFVNVLRFPDLAFQGTLDEQGKLVVPLVGALSFEGLTLEQAREQVRVALDRYVVNPQVDIILTAQRPVQVTILGEVVKPGVYPLQAPQLSTAIVAAGGATRLADLRVVRVRRTLADGTVLERDIDLFSPIRDAAAIPELRLDDGDTIVIPTLTAATQDGYDRELVARSTLAQQQISVRVLNYASNGGGTFANIPMPNGSTFVDALASISPNLDSANMRKIALIRFDTQQGKAVTRELNGRNAIRGDMSQNPPLEHNDVIVIGRNFIARLTHSLNTFTQPFRDVLGFLLFFDSLADSADNLFRPTGRRE